MCWKHVVYIPYQFCAFAHTQRERERHREIDRVREREPSSKCKICRGRSTFCKAFYCLLCPGTPPSPQSHTTQTQCSCKSNQLRNRQIVLIMFSFSAANYQPSASDYHCDHQIFLPCTIRPILSESITYRLCASNSLPSRNWVEAAHSQIASELGSPVEKASTFVAVQILWHHSRPWTEVDSWSTQAASRATARSRGDRPQYGFYTQRSEGTQTHGCSLLTNSWAPTSFCAAKGDGQQRFARGFQRHRLPKKPRWVTDDATANSLDNFGTTSLVQMPYASWNLEFKLAFWVQEMRLEKTRGLITNCFLLLEAAGGCAGDASIEAKGAVARCRVWSAHANFIQL